MIFDIAMDLGLAYRSKPSVRGVFRREFDLHFQRLPSPPVGARPRIVRGAGRLLSAGEMNSLRW